MVDFKPRDMVLNALPVFHSFGLTGGLLLPLLRGVRTFLYPSPLHYRIVPELAYGAERDDPVRHRHVPRRLRARRRQLRLLRRALRVRRRRAREGRDPASLVREVRHPHPRRLRRHRDGAGDRGQHADALPRRHGRPAAARHRASRSSRCRASTTAAGCSSAARTSCSATCAPRSRACWSRRTDGWYDTGDIVDIDAEGFVTIQGRAKRFAKIAGEMVPLGAVEEFVGKVWPDAAHAVVAVPDAKRGEQLVLVTDQKDAARAALLAAAREAGCRRSSCRARSCTWRRCRCSAPARSTT